MDRIYHYNCPYCPWVFTSVDSGNGRLADHVRRTHPDETAGIPADETGTIKDETATDNQGKDLCPACGAVFPTLFEVLTTQCWSCRRHMRRSVPGAPWAEADTIANVPQALAAGGGQGCIGVLLAAVATVALVSLLAVWSGGDHDAKVNDGPTADEVHPEDQDPACHRAALAAASGQPGFQWNGEGMDVYQRDYDACLRAQDVLGG